MKKNRFEPIAVIGYGCVYPPDGYNAEKFWDVIISGKSGIGVVPKERWTWEYYYDEDRNVEDKTYCRLGGYVDSYDFPYSRYNIKKEKILNLNRTQLMMMDTIIQALKKAGIELDSIKNKNIGMFVGNMLGDEYFFDYSLKFRAKEFLYYLEKNEEFKSLQQIEKEKIKERFLRAIEEKYPNISESNWGKALSSTLGKAVRDVLNINGPSMVVDAACGGGIVVIDEAIKWLQTRRLKTCIVSGVLGNMGVTGNVAFAKIGGLSPTHSSPLDVSANGLIPGEGAGTVILKRLDDAIKDGDPIHVVIRGIGVASDGKGKSIYAPSSFGQVKAIRKSLKKGGLKPSDLDYIEAHATSTLIGDKVEVNAIKMLFENENQLIKSVAIGSVKSQIGHTFSAAGMANLIKVIEGMKRNVLPCTYNYKNSPEDLKIEESPIYVNSEIKDWPIRNVSRPRCAAVNAFGFGGINGSMVVEDYMENYHMNLLNETANIIKRSSEELDVAIVGIGCIDNKAVGVEEWWKQIANPVKVSLSYPETRWNSEINEIFKKEDEEEVVGSFMEDFKFKWMEFKIPPVILPQIDKSQLMAMTAAGEAIADYGKEKLNGETTGVFVGAMLGLEASILSALRIRFVEYIKIMENIEEYKQLPSTVKDAISEYITQQYRKYIPKVEEDTLPGYMDNIIAGRIANYFNISGANLVIDADSTSFMSALEQGIMSLQLGESNTIIVGGVHANMAPEFLEVFNNFKNSKKLNCPHCGSPVSDFTPSEGAVFFILKKFSDVTEEDKVYARIRDIYHEGENQRSINAENQIISSKDNKEIFNISKLGYHECCDSFKNERGGKPFYFGAQSGFILLKSVLSLHKDDLSHLKKAGIDEADNRYMVGITSFSLLGGDIFLCLDGKNATKKPVSEVMIQNKLSSTSKSEEHIYLIGADTWIELINKINDVLEDRKIACDSEEYVSVSNYRMAVMYKTEEELIRKLKMVH
ncbi:hypothetical protein G9F71_022400 [Clostridium sp. FP2]|uniref:beta-ketoacyl synthase N-terminal-like domain-containing protein n=1 Tax=Clostridium sp. FP2 TaxID=2724481 RepID=UPI0013E94C54|nr:beta-ketoacyl synthase N-terminal-like domain-containing protein [Clostridium sp. FP2]MBZ9625583.1 hypothetical protein [Clostridium sp. FP2]